MQNINSAKVEIKKNQAIMKYNFNKNKRRYCVDYVVIKFNDAYYYNAKPHVQFFLLILRGAFNVA